MKTMLSLAVLIVMTITAANSGTTQKKSSNEMYSTECSFYAQRVTISAMKCFHKAVKAGSDGGRYLYGLCLTDGIGGDKA